MSSKIVAPAAVFFLSALILSASSTGNLKKNRSGNPPSSDTAIPISLKAKDHKGRNVVSKEGVVSFSSGLDNDYYQLDSINRRGFLYLETKLDKFINERATKSPLNLSIVIDHSGSMMGAKMDYAKQAAKHIVNMLGPDDFVSIVIYDDNAEVIQTAVQVLDKKSITSRIDKINAETSTNLWAGTELGYLQIKGNYRKNFINRVLLISDGLVNTGLTSSYEIRKRVQKFKDEDGITLSSFGVGLDYNELLMTEIAEAGSGNYYFIDKPDQMASIFDKELNGLLNVAAQNAELKIHLPRGIQVTKVFGYKFEQAGQEVTIRFRDLFSEETKGVLLQFSIDDYANVPLKFVSTLSYDDIADLKRKSLTNENLLSPIGDVELYVTHFNEPVLQQTILYIANENMEKAMLEADQGNFDKARGLIQQNSQYLNLNAGYIQNSTELKDMDSTNKNYFMELQKAESMDGESRKYMQKTHRAESYKIRNKKN